MVDPAEANKVPFSPSLVPVASHPLVKERGPDAAFVIQARRLFSYLNFTDFLETEAVVPAAMLIARRKTSLILPDDMVFDGRRIATDEMYHAQCAGDLMKQMSDLTGVPVCYQSQPNFLAELQRIRDELPRDIAPLATLFFSIVSETLITSILKDIPQDEQVFTAVRQVVADHHVDEARHHAYFARVLQLTWEQLTIREKDCIGPLLPTFITLFLTPDKNATIASLSSIGLDEKQATLVFAETYPEEGVQRELSKAAHPALRHLKEIGAFDHSATCEATEASGLVLQLTRSDEQSPSIIPKKELSV
jgi:hypothetical protein